MYLTIWQVSVYIFYHHVDSSQREAAHSWDEEHSVFLCHAPIFLLNLNYWHCPSSSCWTGSTDSLLCSGTWQAGPTSVLSFELMCKLCVSCMNIWISFTLDYGLITNSVVCRKWPAVVTQTDLLLTSLSPCQVRQMAASLWYRNTTNGW